MGLFGKSAPPDPKLQVQEWSKKLRKEGYSLDRQINAIKREEMKVTQAIKMAAKKGDKDSCRILAKEVVHARKAISRIYTTKANLMSVENQMKAQAAQVKVAGSLKQSADVMRSMQQLIKVPEIQRTMMEMSKEMMKAGIIEEMLSDTMEGLEDTEELDEDVQQEVDKVLLELTTDVTKNAPAVHSLPSVDIAEPEAEEEEPAAEVEKDLDEMRERLQALRS